MEKQEMEMKWKLEMETGNGNWKQKLETEMETQALSCCSQSNVIIYQILLVFVLRQASPQLQFLPSCSAMQDFRFTISYHDLLIVRNIAW